MKFNRVAYPEFSRGALVMAKKRAKKAAKKSMRRPVRKPVRKPAKKAAKTPRVKAPAKVRRPLRQRRNVAVSKTILLRGPRLPDVKTPINEKALSASEINKFRDILA